MVEISEQKEINTKSSTIAVNVHFSLLRLLRLLLISMRCCGLATTSIARRRDLHHQYGFAAASFNALLYAAIPLSLIRSSLLPWTLTFKSLPLQTVYMQPRHEIPFAQHYVTQHTVFRFCSPSPACFHYPSLRPPF